MKNYKTVVGEFSEVTLVEKSKFICRIKGVDDEVDAKKYIEKVKKEESFATHNCFAYILTDSSKFKFSDDGEPHGTAGMPMYEILKNSNLFNVVAVVTRYFGGVKLGTGGLSRAYSGAVKKCLQKSVVSVMTYSVICEVVSDYQTYKTLSAKILYRDSVKILSTDFSDKVKVTFAVKEDFFTCVKEDLNGFLSSDILFFEKDRKYLTF